ncbi:unnamed protein product [Calypogeia fissa]
MVRKFMEGQSTSRARADGAVVLSDSRPRLATKQKQTKGVAEDIFSSGQQGRPNFTSGWGVWGLPPSIRRFLIVDRSWKSLSNLRGTGNLYSTFRFGQQRDKNPETDCVVWTGK